MKEKDVFIDNCKLIWYNEKINAFEVIVVPGMEYAKKIQHCVELCLYKVMDPKLTKKMGKDWFDKLYAAESTIRKNKKTN